jgi:hypothetical protein
MAKKRALNGMNHEENDSGMQGFCVSCVIKIDDQQTTNEKDPYRNHCCPDSVFCQCTGLSA